MKMNPLRLENWEQRVLRDAFDEGKVYVLQDMLNRIAKGEIEIYESNWDWSVAKLLEKHNLFAFTILTKDEVDWERGDENELFAVAGSFPVKFDVEDAKVAEHFSYTLNKILARFEKVAKETNVEAGTRFTCPNCRHYMFTISDIAELKNRLLFSYVGKEEICKKCRKRSTVSIDGDHLILILSTHKELRSPSKSATL